MEKSIDAASRILSNIAEYIRYFMVAGISFLSVPLFSKNVFNLIMNQKPAIIILGIFGFGIVLYFINRTIYFPFIEMMSDNANNVFRKYLKSIDSKLKYYQKNDLWIIIQDKENIGGDLNKYKLWKASIEMMSGISFYYLGVSVICFFIDKAEHHLLMIILFIISFVLCLISNINFERRLFHIFKFINDGKYEEKVKKYIEYIK